MSRKKTPYVLEYRPGDFELIQQRQDRIKSDHPEFSDEKVKIWEVISRLEGENGLSSFRVDYLVQATLLALGLPNV